MAFSSLLIYIYSISMSDNKKDWFKLKKYSHIGLPIKPVERSKWIETYVTNPSRVAHHSFLPFIHRSSKVRRFRKKYCSNTGRPSTLSVSGKPLREMAVKTRELYYASHVDSLIYSYYTSILSSRYEAKLTAYNLAEVVCAYRSIPVNPLDPNSSNKCNIDFANDVFKFIKSYDSGDFVAITFDIKSFFDNLNHQILRNAWMNVLDVDILPPDHFNVFKNITRFSYVEIVNLFKEFKDKIITQKSNKVGKLLPIRRQKVAKLKYMRDQNAIAFCTIKEFLSKKNKLLHNYKLKKDADGFLMPRNYGIPQGSPISSVLANIYLLDFDRDVNDFITRFGGLYRRYSDDMVIVCPNDMKQVVIQYVNRVISDDCLLEIQDSKTQIFHFKYVFGELFCGQAYPLGINWNKKFIYLGFEFDGKCVLLRSASLSGYYRKMKRFIARSKRYSVLKTNKNGGEIFKRRIFKRFSQKGAKRRRKWLLDKSTNKFFKSDRFDWGNFLSYTNKAADVMIHNKIRNQTKRHWKKINRLLFNQTDTGLLKEDSSLTMPNDIVSKIVTKPN